MNDPFLSKRAAILHQMAALDSMELGSLKAEYHSSPSGSKSGPYFKHQVWKDGASVSQRVGPEDAPALEAAIDNRLQFESLAQAFIPSTCSVPACAGRRSVGGWVRPNTWCS